MDGAMILLWTTVIAVLAVVLLLRDLALHLLVEILSQ
jgi:hypothetical protein